MGKMSSYSDYNDSQLTTEEKAYYRANANILTSGKVSANGRKVNLNIPVSEFSGNGASNVEIINLMDYATDRSVMTSDVLWRDIVGFMLDGKTVGIRMPLESEELSVISWSERTFILPAETTKEDYITYLLEEVNSRLLVLDFIASTTLYNGSVRIDEVIHITPDGIKMDYLALLVTGYGAIIEASNQGVASEGIMPVGEDGSGLDYSRFGACLANLFDRGIPISLAGGDKSGSFMFANLIVDRVNMITEPAFENEVEYTSVFNLEAHGIGSWEVQGEYYGSMVPLIYNVSYGWVADENVNNLGGYFRISKDTVYPLVIDTRFVPQQGIQE